MAQKDYLMKQVAELELSNFHRTDLQALDWRN